MRIELAGDNALIAYFGDSASPDVSAAVQQAATRIEAQLGDALIDLVPSYASLLIIYNPLQTDQLAVRHALKQIKDDNASATSGGKLVTLPAWYDTEAGPDLAALAKNKQLSIDEVIAIHSQSEYRVYAIGFAPGFAYLGEVDERIAAPRLSTPRQQVPRGAVAIADRQTAVYPAPSPGGWNLIGRCPTRMFNPDASPYMPVEVGDRVRFEPITKAQYLELGGEL